MLRSLLISLGIISPPRKRGRRDIRYAHPSHASHSPEKPMPDKQHAFLKSSKDDSCAPLPPPPDYEKKSFYKKRKDIPSADYIFSQNEEKIRRLTLIYLADQGEGGASSKHIDSYVLKNIMRSHAIAAICENQEDYREKMRGIRNLMKREKRIFYDSDRSVWLFNNDIPIRETTQKEKGFLRHQGVGEGWANIPDEMDAIRWIHREFNRTPERFENFCVSIMKSQGRVPLNVTEKHPISGADGGFDAIGDWSIDGKICPVALQAKCYAPDRQVGSDETDRFFGALLRNKIKHGFMITTATFSKKVKDYVSSYEETGAQIEMIDQKYLIKIMLSKATSPQGFGLHRTEAGMVYMNVDILRRAGEKV